MAEDEDRRPEPGALGGDGRRGEHGHRLEVRHVGLERKSPAGILAARRPGKDHVVADPQRRDVARLGLPAEA